MENNTTHTPEHTDAAHDDEPGDWSFTPPPRDNDCPHFIEGSLFENATLEASRFVQVDYEMAVASALGVIAACCQGLVDVAFPNGYTVPTSLMIMTLAGVSEGKTSLDSEFSRPIRAFEKKKDKKRKDLIRRYERDIDTWKQKEKTLKKALKNSYEKGEETEGIEQKLHELDDQKPVRPISYRFIYERATPSALLHSMHENLPIAYFLSDEAGSLLMGSAFDDVCQFNSLWSGSDIPIDRRTSDSFLLTNARLSANLMMQPQIFRNFIKHKRGQHAYESGFFARFLISHPAPSHQTTLSERSSSNAMRHFHERSLQRMNESISHHQEEKSRTILRFSGTAAKAWREAHQKILEETQNGRAYMEEKGHAKKIMDNVSRVAALLHTFENDDYAEKEITEQYLVKATMLVHHFSGHYMSELAQDPEIVTLANSMINTIRRHANKENIVTHENGQGNRYTFSMSKIKQNSHGDIRDTKVFDRVVSFLEDMGHIKKQTNTSQTRYTFGDTIVLLGTHKPNIRNGELYYVKELPRFTDQEVRQYPYGPSFYTHK